MLLDVDKSNFELFSQVYMEGGWSRLLPSGAIEPFRLLASHGALTANEVDAHLRQSQWSPDGLQSSVWEELNIYTDEEITRLDAEFENTPFATRPGETQTAAEVMAEEAETRQAHNEKMRGYSEHLGVAPVSTFQNLLAFLVAAKVLNLKDGSYSINPVSPLPGEVLPLSPDDQAHEDKLRWDRLHEATANKIIELFRPDDIAPADQLVSDLRSISAQIEEPAESVREAIGQLVDSGDFDLDENINEVASNRQITLRVDWESFFSNRISIRHARPDDIADHS